MSKTNGTPSIVDLYQNGMAVTKIANLKRVSYTSVYNVLTASGLNISSAIAKKRRDAAERVRGGEDATAVADDCGRSMQWLRTACTDHDVVCSPGARATVHVKTFAILATLQNSPDKTQEEIARDFGISCTRVSEIFTKARNNGILFSISRDYNRHWPECFQVLATLQNCPEKTLAAIGDGHNLAGQRIHQILTAGRNSGMLFPGRRHHSENRPHCSTQQTETA